MNLRAYLLRRQQLVTRAIERCVPPDPAQPEGLIEGMRYSLFGGGKRIRPILLMASAESVGGKARSVLPYACALEMIHTYSLVHDDLPAMDDDELRRGRPTTHVKFGEAMAILVGDALLTEAFRIMVEAAARARDPARCLAAIREIATAAGAHGMVAGQVADMKAEGAPADLPTVEFIHVRKTGAIILAAVRAGALLGNATSRQLRRLGRYGERVGLAFQIADDILDSEGTIAVTGKAQGRDKDRKKLTFPAVVGLPAARRRTLELIDDAVAELEPFSDAADPLRAIARFIAARACGPVK